jgi:hypothetical protein
MLECTAERPWGLHADVHNDGECPRCGWTAPGPAGDALSDLAEAAEEAWARAEVLGWHVIDGAGEDPEDEAIAA